jgi:outer membrane lipoprotein-sorting protein
MERKRRAIMMKKSIIGIVLGLLIFAVGGAQVHGQTTQSSSTGEDTTVGTEGAGQGLTAKEMVNNMMDQIRGDSSHGVMDMKVVTPDWERTMGMEWWEKGEKLMLVRILSPSRDRGNGTLKVDNNLWNYVYTFDQTVHIPPAMMAQSWMGSDFTNDDIIRESSIVNDYNHKLEGIEEVGDVRAYSILLTTDPSTPVPWLTIRVFLRVEDLLPVKEEYYDDSGNLARTMTFSDFQEMGGRTIPATMRMVPENKQGHYTEMTYTSIEFDTTIDDSVFTLQNLQNPNV